MNSFANDSRSDAVRILDWVGRTASLTGVDSSDANFDTEYDRFSGMFCGLLKEGGKAVSSILTVPLCYMEKAIDR